jgi:hypothetical protein
VKAVILPPKKAAGSAAANPAPEALKLKPDEGPK